MGYDIYFCNVVFTMLQFMVKQTLDILHDGPDNDSVDNKKTVIDWFSFCRDVCSHWLLRNPFQIGKYIFLYL